MQLNPPIDEKCENDHRSRLLLVCYVLLGLFEASEERWGPAVACMVLAATQRTCNPQFVRVAACLASMAYLLEGHHVGAVGYGLLALHLEKSALALLTTHYAMTALEPRQPAQRLAEALIAGQYGTWLALKLSDESVQNTQVG